MAKVICHHGNLEKFDICFFIFHNHSQGILQHMWLVVCFLHGELRNLPSCHILRYFTLIFYACVIFYQMHDAGIVNLMKFASDLN